MNLEDIFDSYLHNSCQKINLFQNIDLQQNLKLLPSKQQQISNKNRKRQLHNNIERISWITINNLSYPSSERFVLYRCTRNKVINNNNVIIERLHKTELNLISSTRSSQNSFLLQLFVCLIKIFVMMYSFRVCLVNYSIIHLRTLGSYPSTLIIF